MNDSLSEIIDRIDRGVAEMPPSKRCIIVAIAGAPASGKSTLSETLNKHYGNNSVIVPMDGFHLDNTILIERNILARKGSEQSFDAAGYVHCMARIARGEHVYAPRFDRSLEVSIGSAIEVKNQTIIITEGNYLLIDNEPWRSAQQFFDITIFIDTPLPILEERLIARWNYYELEPDKFDEKIHGNDLVNARFVKDNSVEPDLRIG